MSQISEYILNIDNFKDSLLQEIKLEIIKNQGKILSKAKLRLFNYGIDGEGKKIMPTYSPSTIEFKKIKRQRTSFVTLRDTGEFYGSMFIDFKENEVIINSMSYKTSFLILKYGVSIMRLTEQEELFIIDSIIEPFIIKKAQELSKDIDLF